MQKMLISGTLSFFMLLQAIHIDFSDISNFKNLINHANYHQEQYGDNLIEFLYEHYVDNDLSKNQQHHEHQNLPFKQGVNHFNHLPSIINFNTPFFELITTNQVQKKEIFFYSKIYFQTSTKSIFQPPRIV